MLKLLEDCETTSAIIESQHVTVPTPTEIFDALDGHSLELSDQRWRIEIYSLLEQDGWRWVHLALRGETDHVLIVKVLPFENENHVVGALLTWLDNPTRASDTVMSLG